MKILFLISLLISFTYQFKKHITTQLHHQEEEEQTTPKKLVNWECHRYELAQLECTSSQNIDQQTMKDQINAVNAYMADYAVNLDVIYNAIKCFEDEDPAFWKCFIDSFKKCLNVNSVNLPDINPIYKVYPNLPDHLYNKKCFCEMDSADVIQKDMIFQDLDGQDTQNEDYLKKLLKQAELNSDHPDYFRCVLDDHVYKPKNYTGNFKIFNNNCLEYVKEQDQAQAWNDLFNKTETDSTVVSFSDFEKILDKDSQIQRFKDITQCLNDTALSQSTPIMKYTGDRSQLNEFKCLSNSINRTDPNAYSQIFQYNKIVQEAEKQGWGIYKVKQELEKIPGYSNNPLLKCLDDNIPSTPKYSDKSIFGQTFNKQCLDPQDFGSMSKDELQKVKDFVKESEESSGSTSSWLDYIKNFYDKQKNPLDPNNPIYKCIEKQIPYKDFNFNKPFDSMNDCKQYLNQTNLSEVEKYAKFAGAVNQNDENWVDVKQDFSKMDFSENPKLKQCFLNKIPNIKSFNNYPFSDLNKQCLGQYQDTKNQDQLNKLNQLINEADKKGLSWIEFKKIMERLKLNISTDPLFQCIMKNIPQINEFKTEPFNKLNNCIEKYLDTTSKTDIENSNSFVNQAEKCSNWKELQKVFEDYNFKQQDNLRKCFEDEIPFVPIDFQSPFDSLNQCKKQIDLKNQQEVRNYNKLVEKSKQDKNWIDFKQMYEKQSDYKSSCIEKLIPELPQDFKSPFTILNKCVKLINLSSNQDMDDFNKFQKQSLSLSDWKQLRDYYNQYKKSNTNISKEDFFKCADPLIPQQIDLPFGKQFDVLNKKCASELNLKNRDEILNQVKLVDQVSKDTDWQSFSNSFTEFENKQLNGKLGDGYFKCIIENIPIPEALDFPSPFEILNEKCKNLLNKNLNEAIAYNTLVNATIAEKPRDWEQINNDFKKVILEENKDIKEQSAFQCIQKLIPEIKYFKAPFEELNSKCVYNLLDKTSREQILKLDDLVLNPQSSANFIEQNEYNYAFYTTKDNFNYEIHQDHFQSSLSFSNHHIQQQQNKTVSYNKIPLVKQKDYPEIDQKFELNNDQKQWEALISTIHAKQLSISQQRDNNPDMYECIEKTGLQKILLFKQSTFQQMNERCLDKIDAGNMWETEQTKFLMEKTYEASSYNQLYTEFVTEQLSDEKQQENDLFKCYYDVITMFVSNKKAVATAGGLYLFVII